MILDTNAISALFENDPVLHARIASERFLHLPAIALGEYRFGLRASRLRVELDRRLLSLESRSVLLSVDSDTAHPYADIRHELKIAGTPIPVNDLWIAALARQHSLPILSDDAHFDFVTGVKRVGW